MLPKAGARTCVDRHLVNAQVESANSIYPAEVELSGYKLVMPAASAVDEAVKLIEGSVPSFFVDIIVIMSKAEEELMEFAVKTQTPVANTLLRLGAFPASHELNLGMMGCMVGVLPTLPSKCGLDPCLWNAF